jgi:hypothetical protein
MSLFHLLFFFHCGGKSHSSKRRKTKLLYYQNRNTCLQCVRINQRGVRRQKGEGSSFAEMYTGRSKWSHSNISAGNTKPVLLGRQFRERYWLFLFKKLGTRCPKKPSALWKNGKIISYLRIWNHSDNYMNYMYTLCNKNKALEIFCPKPEVM